MIKFSHISGLTIKKIEICKKEIEIDKYLPSYKLNKYQADHFFEIWVSCQNSIYNNSKHLDTFKVLQIYWWKNKIKREYRNKKEIHDSEIFTWI